jgi:D-alanyl-D-alanine carboxypeptidase
VVTALAAGKDEDVVAAFGGGAAFRGAVVDGAAPCVDLGDPHRLWIVVDKKRPLNPLDVEPSELVAPADMQRTVDGGCSRRPPRR